MFIVGSDGDDDDDGSSDSSSDDEEALAPPKKKRGRPKGSKNKPSAGPGRKKKAARKKKGSGPASDYDSDKDYEAEDHVHEHEEAAQHDGDDLECLLYPGLPEGGTVAEEPAEEYLPFNGIDWGGIDDEGDVDAVGSHAVPFSASGPVGSSKLSNMKCLLDILFKLQPYGAWQSIVSEINNYGEIREEESEFESPRRWINTTIGELLRLHGLLLSMALMQFRGPTKNYWSGKKIGAVQWPNFTEFMSLFRYQQLMSRLHFRSNDSRPPMATREGRLWQVEWLEDILNTAAKECWSLARSVCVDEKSLPSRHKYCPIRVYNPTKPHKFAIVQQAMVDSEGYIWHTWLYDRVKRPGLKRYIAQLMLDTLPHKGHKVYWDRWYGATNLLQQCTAASQNSTMTLAKNYIPTELRQYKKTNTVQGESHFVYSNEIKACICVWKDRALVVYGSNFEKPRGGSVNRLQPDHSRTDVDCSEMGVEYNKARPFVDAIDSKALGTGSLEVAVRHHKWYLSPYFGLFDCTTCRLEVLAKAAGLYDNRLDCMLQLQKELLENKLDNPVSGARRMTRDQAHEAADVDRRFTGVHEHVMHYDTRIVDGRSKEVKIQRACAVCVAENYGKYVTKTSTKTGYEFTKKQAAPRPKKWCKQCKVHLCSGVCFARYHRERIEHLDYGPMPPQDK